MLFDETYEMSTENLTKKVGAPPSRVIQVCHTFPLRSDQIEGPKLGNVSSKRFEPQSGSTRLLHLYYFDNTGCCPVHYDLFHEVLMFSIVVFYFIFVS